MNKLKVLFLSIIAIVGIMCSSVYAAKPLDEIEDYEIVVYVNSDGTLNMYYHIEWKVLDSKTDGPLTWVKIGIPNNHVEFIPGSISSNVRNARINTSSGCFAELYFDRSYYADEVVSFDFAIHQDYMYQMNKNKDGETVYEFTPGWFDEIKVKKLAIFWDSENVLGQPKDSKKVQNFYVWTTSLNEGKKYPISVEYRNTAYNFKSDVTIKDDNDDTVEVIIVLVMIFVLVFLFIGVPVILGLVAAKEEYNNSIGFGKDVQITRTVIKYYESCPGCGGLRDEKTNKCQFCGRSMVESEEILSKEDVKGKEAAAVKYKKEGTYKYGNSGNTYIHVHVVKNNPRPVRSTSSGRGGCAHSSCACACACACAGGGRAGCTNKDFYSTKLKLSQLKVKKEK